MFHLLGGFSVRPVHEVAIDVYRRRERRMASDLLDIRGRDIRPEHKAYKRMPQIMDADRIRQPGPGQRGLEVPIAYRD
jgi:hypothetical protein